MLSLGCAIARGVMTTVSEPGRRARRAWARRPLHDKLLHTAARLGGLGVVAVFQADLHLP